MVSPAKCAQRLRELEDFNRAVMAAQTTDIDYSMGDNRDWDSDISDEEQLAGSDYFNDIGSR